MGRELAAAIGRWSALEDHPVVPELVGVCDTSPEALRWFDRIASVTHKTTDRRHLLEDDTIDVLYLAVPHHLHEELYLDAAAAGKDFLGEKPFGIDLAAAERIVAAIEAAGVFVRCSSEMPFFPGAQLAHETIAHGRARPGHRGPARLPALERPRSHQADQLEAPGALLRRDRRHGRPRDARRPPAAAARMAAAHRLRPALRPRHRAPRSADRRARALRHDRQRHAALRRRLPADPAHPPDRARPHEHLAHPRDRHGRRRELLDRAAEDRAPLRAARRPPGLGAPGGRKPVGLRHRSPDRSSSSASPTPSCRCGPPTSPSEPASWASASAAPRPPRRSPRTACSTRRCAPDRPDRAEPV